MDRSTFDDLISSLTTKRPIRVIRFCDRDVSSIEWRPYNQPWQHLMTIPNGEIHKYRHEGYKSRFGTKHQSLIGVYNKLVGSGLISPSNKSLFLN